MKRKTNQPLCPLLILSHKPTHYPGNDAFDQHQHQLILYRLTCFPQLPTLPLNSTPTDLHLHPSPLLPTTLPSGPGPLLPNSVSLPRPKHLQLYPPRTPFFLAHSICDHQSLPLAQAFPEALSPPDCQLSFSLAGLGCSAGNNRSFLPSLLGLKTANIPRRDTYSALDSVVSLLGCPCSSPGNLPLSLLVTSLLSRSQSQFLAGLVEPAFKSPDCAMQSLLLAPPL